MSRREPEASADEPGRSRGLEWLAALLPLLVVTLALAVPVLDPGLQLYDRDTGVCEYPLKAELARRLQLGQLPLWIPWSEAGTSMLAQMTPGLFHPLTLLYLLAPFELAFKLNHLLALPIAGLCLLLLARKLGLSPLAAGLSAATFAGSGWMVSMVSSNLHFALGLGSIPWALWGLWRFAERPGGPRLLLAGLCLALPVLTGEPQSTLFAALGGAFLLWRLPAPALPLLAHPLLRRGSAFALWGLCAALLSAPALLPVALRLRDVAIAPGVNASNVAEYALPPARLAGLFLPWAFDDTREQVFEAGAQSTYEEFAHDPPRLPFSNSIALGVPALLLALAAARARRGRWLVLAAALCLAAALGSHTPVEPLLRALIPALRLFRYPEKYLAPATLLFALAAGCGAEGLLQARSRRVAVSMVVFALALAAGAALLAHQQTRAEELLRSLGQTGARAPAHAAIEIALESLQLQAALALCLGLSLLLLRSRAAAGISLASVCCVSTLAATSHLLSTAPLSLLRQPSALGRELVERAGPSPGRWRYHTLEGPGLIVPGADRRLGLRLWLHEALEPQLGGLDDLDGVAVYSSLADQDYIRAWSRAPDAMSRLFGVRFLLRSTLSLAPGLAEALHFESRAHELLFLETPFAERAVVTGCAEVGGVEKMGKQFEPAQSALLRPRDAATAASFPCVPGEAGGAVLEARARPEQLALHVDATRPGLVVIPEHYDAGWSATLDGAPIGQALQVDAGALGARVPAGSHELVLTFFPRGLRLGLVLAGLCVSALLAAPLVRRRSRLA